MSVRQLSLVLIRTWAIVWFVEFVFSLPQLASFMFLPGGGDVTSRAARSMWTINFVFGLVGAAVLFAIAPRLANWIVPDDSEWTLAVDGRALAIVAVTVMGIYFVVAGARDVGTGAFALVVKERWDETNALEYIWSRYRDEAVRGVISLAAGAFLVIRNRWVAGRFFGDQAE